MATTIPTIYRLTIERFRGIQSLTWQPTAGFNLILGGGDTGKTTVLDAIGLLLSPTNPTSIADTDYFNRKIDEGFTIEAIIGIPSTVPVNRQTKQSWPWTWNGSDAVIPAADGPTTGEPVFRLRVRGTPDLEYSYEIVQPDDTTDTLSSSLRRSIGLVRLSADENNDRDLRLVQGSALDRLLSDAALRSRLAAEFAKTEVQSALSEESITALSVLDAVFISENLPNELNLAVTGGQGFSIAALIGLTADRKGVKLPLSTWGAGTRRIASLTIAEQNQGESPITLVDEIERGLEPYRQRTLVDKLQNGTSQSFVTTHSPATISAASKSSIWYIDHAGQIGPLDADKISRLRAKDPEAFLSRLTVVAEGATELGFVTTFLEAVLAPLSLKQCGIHVCDGGGHEETLLVLEALATGGLKFAGFADNEDGKHPTRWNRVEQHVGSLLFRWNEGCVEENVLAKVSDDSLLDFITDPDGEKIGIRLRTLADRLNITEKDFDAVKAQSGDSFRTVLIEAALGKVPDDKVDRKKEYIAHASRWFKSIDGGCELYGKIISLGLWPSFKPLLLPFANAIRTSIGLSEIEDISQ